MNPSSIAVSLLLVLVLTIPGYASASDFAVSIQQNTVSVTATLRAFQNMTELRREFTLPQFSVFLNGSNSSEIATRLSESISINGSHGIVSDVVVKSETSSYSNVTGAPRQWYNLTLSFSLAGVSSDQPEGKTVNVSWKSFAVSSSLVFNGLELNRIGSAYLQGIAQDFASERPRPGLGLFYRVNGKGITPAVFPVAVEKIVYLNFSSLNKPLSDWALSYKALTDTRNYTLSVRGLGMSFTRTFTEGTDVESTTYGLFYNLAAQVNTPEPSQVDSDSVLLQSGIPETVMGAIVLASVLVGGAAFLYERRVLGSPGRRKLKR